MNLILVTVLIGNMTITSYRSVPKQTDKSPWLTSIGERVHPHGIAVSRDLLSRWGGPLNYGDTIYVEGYGFKVVNDVMHERKKQSIDIWVATIKEEKQVGIRHGRIWLVKSELKEEKNVWQKIMAVNLVLTGIGLMLGGTILTILHTTTR